MADDDRLLRGLGQLAREQREKAPPAEMLSPLDDGMAARLTADALARLGGPARAPVVEARPSLITRLRWWLAVGVPLAAAAAGVLMWTRSQAPSLPAYAMIVSGGVAEYRSGGGAPEAPLTVTAGSRVEVLLRPEVTAAAPVDARVFWVRGEEVRPWAATVQRSDEGAVRFTGTGEVPFGPGEGSLVAIVAPEGNLPAGMSAAKLASPPGSWQVFRRAVRWP